jgi:hypothetical protein
VPATVSRSGRRDAGADRWRITERSSNIQDSRGYKVVLNWLYEVEMDGGYMEPMLVRIDNGDDSGEKVISFEEPGGELVA